MGERTYLGSIAQFARRDNYESIRADYDIGRDRRIDYRLHRE